MIDVKYNYFAIYACQVITLSSFNLHSVVCQLHLNKTGRKKRHNEWLKDSFQRGPQRLYLLGSGLLGDFYQSDITSFGQLSPEEECALSKRGCTELLGF